MVEYTFGTDNAGASRLENIASFFNPLATQFIQTHLGGQPCLTAVDLGCGPGFTTDMLARVTGCAATCGLDNAAHFVQMAAARFPDYTFIQHDVTRIPFPVQADVMYVRFVLSHLSDVVQTVNRWVSTLKPEGLLFVDEVEAVESEIPVFQQYLATNAGMIAAQGANLWVGATLAEGCYEAGVVSSTCDVVSVANAQAATWFLPNTQTVWRTDRYVRAHLSQEEQQAISAEMARIKESGDERLQNTWKMRRLVLRR
jgi:trans-aconitate 2-methyltransferase